MKRIKLLFFSVFVLLFGVTNSKAQGNTCPGTPFCTAVGTPYDYANVNNGSTASGAASWGCLFNEPDPSWFYIKTTAAGAMTFVITQGTTVGANDLDVDFIAYGPFTNAQFPTACSNLTGSCSTDHSCVGNIADCSYSAASTENMTLNSPGAGVYYVIMITNFTGITSPPGIAGFITFTQTGGPGSDCSITCPPTSISMLGQDATTNANIPNGSTVQCASPFWVLPNEPTPFTDPNTDILTPCIAAEFNPFNTNENTNGSVSVSDSWLSYNLCNGCPQGNIGLGTGTNGSDYSIYFGWLDSTQNHDFQFCNTSTVGSTVVTLKNCWDGTVYAGPVTWNTTAASCFTLTVPPNTNMGSAVYSINPAGGGSGVVDLHDGYAYVDPSFIAAGTYTLTYTFHGRDGCAPGIGTYVFTVPTKPVVTITPSATTICSGSSVTLTGGGASTYTWLPGGATGGTLSVNPGTTSSYTVTGTDGSGCENTAFATVTVTAPPTLTLSAASYTICNGSSQALSVSGATTYTWTPGATLNNPNIANPTATPASTTVYTVTGTSAGCVASPAVTATVNVTAPPTLTLSAASYTICNGGSQALSVSGGTTYTWTPGATLNNPNIANPTATPASTTVYTVTGTSTGCVASPAVTATVNVTAPPTLTLSATSYTICNGGSQALSVSGGTTYTWTPGATLNNPNIANPTATPASTTVYTVTGTSTGCVASPAVTATINVIAPPTLTLSAASYTICNGGSQALSVSGATTYTWTPGATLNNPNIANPTATPASTTVYTVTGTNTGCATSPAVTATVNVTAPPILTLAANSYTICNGSSQTFTVSGASTYTWTSAATLTGANTSNPVANPITTTIYTVSGTTSGCVPSAPLTVTLSVNPQPTLTLTANSYSICNGNSQPLSVSGGTTYTWTPAATLNNPNIFNPTATPAATTVYSVTGTDGNGCSNITAPATATVTVNPTPTVSISGGGPNSQTVCAGGAVSPITFSITPAGTVSWTNSNTSLGGPDLSSASGSGNIGGYASPNVLSQTTGVVTANATANGSGCPSTNSTQLTYTLIINPLPVITGSVVTSAPCGQITGCVNSVTASGSSPFQYSWTGGAPWSVSSQTCNIASGSYIVDVKDNNGCIANASIAVPSQNGPNATIASSASVTCNGASTGSASVSVTGGAGAYSYTWAPSGGNAANATNLPAGNYTCTVSDINNCTTTTATIIAQPVSPISITPSFTPATCGQSNGAANVSASGGTPGYTYSWTPSGGTGPTASGLAFGNYSCTITDLNNCPFVNAFSLPNTNGPTATISSTGSVSCHGSSTGSVTVNVTGGTGAITYTWAPTGGNAATASNLLAGTYTCNVSDGSGCSTNTIVTISQPTVALTAATSFTPAICGQSNGTASVTVSGGTSGYTYTWSPIGGNASSATGLPANNYTCSITDANGCPQSASLTVTNAGGPSATIASSASVACNGTSTGSASVSVTGGTGAITYTWTPIGGNAASATNLPAGTYTCSVQDVNLCATNTVVTISQPTAALNVTGIASTSITCNGLSNGTATVSASGGTGSYTYTWSPTGGNAASATNLPAGTYTCFVKDINLCSTNTVVIIAQPAAALAASISLPTTSVTCNGLSNGVATATVTGGTSPYTYTWSPSGGNNATSSGIPAGTYTCFVKDANGCTKNAITNITQPIVALNLNVSSIGNVSCNGGANGSVTVSPSGGTGSINYTWTPSGGNANTASGLSAGIYTCSITDANGCPTNTVVTITQPIVALTASISSVSVTCNGGTNGSATAIASGGTGPYTSYSWTPIGGAAGIATSLPAGNYTCTILDSKGCSQTATTTVTEPLPFVITNTVTSAGCSGGSNGSASISVAGGTSPYTITWSTNPVQTGVNAGNLTAGSYTAAIKDNNNCPTNPIIIILDSAPKDSLEMIGTLCGTDSTVVLSAPHGGTAPDIMSAPYQWYGGIAPIPGATGVSYTANQNNVNLYSVTWFYHGCRYISTTLLETIYQDISHLPQTNIFTPNGDKVNDDFLPFSLSVGTTVTYQQIAAVVEDYELFIFDRWGVLVFKTNQPLDMWDGIETNGKEATAGTYYWMAKYKSKCNISNPDQTIKGFVQLIR